MKLSKDTMLVYAVTDRAWTGKMTLLEQVEAALKNGATCVQLRVREFPEEAILQEAIEMAKLCKSYNVPFIVNDNVDIAIKSGADGVHVGQDDMAAMDVRAKVGPDMIIGVSAHTVEEALDAVKNGADYLGIGAVFNTTTKTDVSTMSSELLKQITEASRVPTCGIGGISKNNISLLQGSGLDGVAVVSAIFAREDPGAATKELKELAIKYLR
ncbi:MAG: thiamine phosphate synthase [Oscillospiraceae bacterium]|nr:thiamine phosphate synthase [Oscillospiraceae bacterium]